MNTKHTPGPWTATLANTIIPANGTRIIATAWRNSELPSIPEEEQAANAKLIAAAPDLLAALIATTDAFDCLIQDQLAHLPRGRLIKWAEIEAARAAIAAATS